MSAERALQDQAVPCHVSCAWHRSPQHAETHACARAWQKRSRSLPGMRLASKAHQFSLHLCSSFQSDKLGSWHHHPAASPTARCDVPARGQLSAARGARHTVLPSCWWKPLKLPAADNGGWQRVQLSRHQAGFLLQVQPRTNYGHGSVSEASV